MLPTPFQTLPFPSFYSSPSSRSPHTSPSSHSLDASFSSSFGLIEAQYPAISQIFDCAIPSSSSSKPMPFRATAFSSSTTLEPKFEYSESVSDNSLELPSPSGKSFSHAIKIGDIPPPLESLQSSPIPPFLSKTYEIVNDPSLDRVVSWGLAGKSFVVWDPVDFSTIVLPQHFKHSNFSSFVRQLNTYGFRKIDSDRWEFANKEFLRGKRLLLKNINRRRSSYAQHIGPYLGSSIEMELSGTEDELQKLRNHKSMLMQEVVKMKLEHLVTVKQMDALNCRLESAEVRQNKMMSFWRNVVRNPVFLMHLKQSKKQRETDSTRSIKRYLKQEQPRKSEVNKTKTQRFVKYSQSFCEPGSACVLTGLESHSVTQLPDHLLQDMSDKLGVDVNVKDVSSNKPLEILEPSFGPNASFKGKNLIISKDDDSLCSADFLISSPEEFSSDKMALGPISPSSYSFTQQDLRIDTFNGKSAGEIQDGMVYRTQYLASSVDDISQEPMLLYSVKPPGEVACEEEFWNVGFEAGGSSAYDVWDNLVCANPEVPGVEIGLSAMFDFGLHSDEGFDIGKCFGSQFPLPQHVDEGGVTDDHPKASKL